MQLFDSNNQFCYCHKREEQTLKSSGYWWGFNVFLSAHKSPCPLTCCLSGPVKTSKIAPRQVLFLQTGLGLLCAGWQQEGRRNRNLMTFQGELFVFWCINNCTSSKYSPCQILVGYWPICCGHRHLSSDCRMMMILTFLSDCPSKFCGWWKALNWRRLMTALNSKKEYYLDVFFFLQTL